MNKLLALVLVLFSTLTWADNRSWSESEKTWGIVTANLLLLDYATSRDMTHRYSEGYYEKFNPLLGNRPSTTTVDLYFVTAGLATWLIADNLVIDDYADACNPKGHTMNHGYLAVDTGGGRSDDFIFNNNGTIEDLTVQAGLFVNKIA